MTLDDRSAIVTGASSGIGRATAERLAHDGASVCINYFSADESDAAAEVVAAIDRAGRGRAIAVQADVGSEDDVRRMVAETVQAFGTVNLLVNNAGIEKHVPLLETSLQDWERTLRTNLTGAFLCMREAATVMVERGEGVVVNMSSVHEFIPWPGFAPYCASKGGLKLLMQTAARELAPRGVRMVNIAPGAITTPINDSLVNDPAARKEVESEIPLGRMGRAEEIAAAVAWAASPEAGYVTGTTIVVDGGMSLYPRFV
jgi:glucose 1-dehydrogenase